MATMKRLSLIYEIRNFANTQLGKVTKIQGNGLIHFGVLSHLLGWRKTPPIGYRVSHIEFILSMEIPLDNMHRPHSLLLWLLDFHGKKILQ